MGSLKLLPVLILLGPAAALAQSPTFGLEGPRAQMKSAFGISPSVPQEKNCLRDRESPREARVSID